MIAKTPQKPSRVTLAHLSDLHFGAHDDDARDRLKNFLVKQKPDFICVTGDIADGARPTQYQQAATFLSQLGITQIFAIPGNHDYFPVLYKLGQISMVFPHCHNSSSEFVTDFVLVGDQEFIFSGIDTTTFDQFINTSGRFHSRSKNLLEARLEELRQGNVDRFRNAFKVLMMHHHPLPTQSAELEQLLYMKNSHALLALAAEYRFNLILHGHRHDPHYFKLNIDSVSHEDALLVLSAGSALKKNDTANQFYMVDIFPERVEVRDIRRVENEFLPLRHLISRRAYGIPTRFRRESYHYKITAGGDLHAQQRTTIAARPGSSIHELSFWIAVTESDQECDDTAVLALSVYRDNAPLDGASWLIERNEPRQKRIRIHLEPPVTTTPTEVKITYSWPGGCSAFVANDGDSAALVYGENIERLEITFELEDNGFRVFCPEHCRAHWLGGAECAVASDRLSWTMTVGGLKASHPLHYWLRLLPP